MADGIAALLAFPPENSADLSATEYDTEIRKYLKELDSVPIAAWIQPVDDKDLLDLLDPTVNTLPYIFAINGRFENAGNNEQELPELVARTRLFLTSFDPVQMRYAGAEWLELMDTLIKLYSAQQSHDISLLVNAVLRLDPTAGTFTSIHLAIVRLAIAGGVPSQALPILDKSIYAFPENHLSHAPDTLVCEASDFSNSYITKKSGFSLGIGPETILTYYLQGASIYLALGKYNRARLFLESILLTTSVQNAVSGLQVEAYKKWVLLGLLSGGALFPTPKTISQALLKAVRSLSKAYDSLAESFVARDSKKFKAEADVGQSIWQEDGNLRLVEETSDALMRYRVLDLKKTFAALPVTRLASSMDLSLDETMKLLEDMDRLGFLHADITTSGQEAVLRFHPEQSDLPSAHDLESQTERIKQLISHISDADRRLQLTRDWLEHRKKPVPGGQNSEFANEMDIDESEEPESGQDEDENLMS